MIALESSLSKNNCTVFSGSIGAAASSGVVNFIVNVDGESGLWFGFLPNIIVVENVHMEYIEVEEKISGCLDSLKESTLLYCVGGCVLSGTDKPLTITGTKVVVFHS